jgi:hypothetical protein
MTAIRPRNATCETAYAIPHRKLHVWPLPPMNTGADTKCIRINEDEKNIEKDMFEYMTKS